MISVLNEPVIRVRFLDGTDGMMGIRELLLQSDNIKDIIARTPTGKIAIIRHLIAFGRAAHVMKTLKSRRKLFAQKRFDPETIDNYIDECERDGPRFLLDDETHPYMQSAYDEALDKKAERSVAYLLMDVPTGNNHIFLDHRPAEDYAASLSEAFEALLETYMFCPAGLAGSSNVNNTPPVYALVLGRNLFETLVLNMVSESELGNIALGAGDEPWRSGRKVIPKQSVATVSYLQALTWQPRRIKLIIDDDRKVRRIFYQAGLDFRGDGNWYDPNVPYRKGKDGNGDSSLKPVLGRNMWRDSSLLTAPKVSNGRQPVPLSNIKSVWENRDSSSVQIEVTGLITNQAICIGWLNETLIMPEAILNDPKRAEEFRTWIQFSEEMNSLLWKTVTEELSDDEHRDKDKPHNAQVASQASAVFLQCMHDGIWQLMYYLADEADAGEKLSERKALYSKTLLKGLDTALNTIVNCSGTTIDAMKRQEKVRGIVISSCKKRLKGEGYEWKQKDGT